MNPSGKTRSCCLQLCSRVYMATTSLVLRVVISSHGRMARHGTVSRPNSSGRPIASSATALLWEPLGAVCPEGAGRRGWWHRLESLYSIEGFFSFLMMGALCMRAILDGSLRRCMPMVPQRGFGYHLLTASSSP